MSLITPDEVQAGGLLLELSGAALQAAIDEEEAWLARKLHGALTGERIERFALASLPPGTSTIHLRRPTDAVEGDLDGADITDQLEVRGNGWHVSRLPEGTYYSGSPGVLAITYSPVDELEVKRALRGLVNLTASAQRTAGLQGEVLGSYSWQRAQGSTTRLRLSILRDLLEPPAATSLRTRSSVRHGLAGVLDR